MIIGECAGLRLKWNLTVYPNVGLNSADLALNSDQITLQSSQEFDNKNNDKHVMS